IVKAVAERDDYRGIVAIDDLGEADERLARVVGRQKGAALGMSRALLQVQVGHQQRPVGMPIERTGAVGDERPAANRDRQAHRAFPSPSWGGVRGGGTPNGSWFPPS